jgi:hypothetical protein
MPTGQMTTGLAAVVKAASLSDAEEQLASTATARMKSFLDTRRVQLGTRRHVPTMLYLLTTPRSLGLTPCARVRACAETAPFFQGAQAVTS